MILQCSEKEAIRLPRTGVHVNPVERSLDDLRGYTAEEHETRILLVDKYSSMPVEKGSMMTVVDNFWITFRCLIEEVVIDIALPITFS
jgi:hypothetical protein